MSKEFFSKQKHNNYNYINLKKPAISKKLAEVN
jgi:hypothetical protein